MLKFKKKIVLCASSDPCCPTVELASKGFVLKDDFGGKVQLTKDQFTMLLDQGKKLVKK
jgi:hypothetical protein